MSKLTIEFLNSIGVSMDEQTFATFSKHFDETLLRRVEERVIENLTTDQIQEFSTLRDSGHDIIWAWLQANVVNLSDVIQTEVNTILGEVIQNSDDL